MSFEVISEITDIEIIAVGSSIREIARLRKQYGKGRWRKLKGIATIRLASAPAARFSAPLLLLPTVRCISMCGGLKPGSSR